MKTNKFKIACIIMLLLFNSNELMSQATVLGNSGTGGDYVGWQQGTGINLDIVNEDQLPINFYTNGGAGSGGMWNNLRMFIQGTDGNVGIGNFATANTLLHLHQSADDRDVNFQMTNSSIGNATTDGFLVDVDGSGLLRLNQQERAPMQFWGTDATLGNSNVIRGEWTYGNAMQENQIAPTDGFRIWNPGYSSSTSYNPNHALDLWCGVSNTTHIRFDHSGLIQTINLRFEQIARLDGFWFDARPYDYQKIASPRNYRGRYFFNIDSVEISRFSNTNNTDLGFMRIGKQPAGQLGIAGIDATRRLEIYDAADVPQFRITRATDASFVPQVFTDFQTTNIGNLFINPINGANAANVGIGISIPTAKLEVNSPTVSGGTQTTLRLDNINTGAGHPRGIDIDIQGTGGGLTQATGINLNMTGTLSTSSAAAYITNATTGAGTGHGIWSNLTGANVDNYGLRSYVTNATGTNYGSYQTGSGGTSAFGSDSYALNGSSLNYALRGTATGTTGSTDARGISASASGSTTNYGAFLKGTAASTNTAYGAYSEGYGGDVAFGVYAKASGATTTNWAVFANGNAWSTGTWQSSDATLKSNILPMQNNTAIVMQLQPKSYNFNQTVHPELVLPSGTHYGLVAQELEQVVPSLVKDVKFPAQYDSTGAITSAAFAFKSVNYIEVIPFLIGTIQELKLELDSLKSFVFGSTPSQKINYSEDPSQKIILSNQQGIILNQNDPNPFTESTRITFQIPDEVRDAKIIFTSLTGSIINTAIINERGAGELEVYSSELSKGLYNYTLVCDGKVIASKKMVKQ
ncbi:MAG: tail fiber domain-containing protein [Bacteroidetes bacterium]|nr:tail fiber domain-containing protein [Bacteroidota bacterium]